MDKDTKRQDKRAFHNIKTENYNENKLTFVSEIHIKGDTSMKCFRIMKYIIIILLVAFTILLNCGQGYLLKQDIVYSDRLILIKIVLTWLIVPFTLVISYGSFMSHRLGDSRAVAAVFISNGVIIFVISIAFVIRLLHFALMEERPLYDADVPRIILHYEPLNPYLYKIERRSMWSE